MCGGDKDETFEFRKQRSCTDVLMFLLYVAGFAAVFIILGTSINAGGDPWKVINGVDFDGNICGITSGFTDYKYAAWPKLPVESADPAFFQVKVCLASCGETQTNTSVMVDTYETWNFYRYCVPTAAATAASGAMSSNFTSGTETAARAISDLYTTWPVILVAGFVALIVSFLYIKAMKIECCRTVLVWGVIFLMIAGGFLFGYSLIRYAKDAKDAASDVSDRAYAAEVTGWIVVACSAVFLLIVFGLRKRIAIAIEVTGAAASAVDQMKSIILFPIFPFILAMCYIVLWIIVALFIFSVKDRTTQTLPADYTTTYFTGKTSYFEYDWNTHFQKLFAYHFFHLLWALQFLVYLTFFTISGAIANWYFSKPDPASNGERRIEGSQDDELPSSPVCSSFWRAIRYHMGTIAYGALLIAIVEMIRVALYYVQRRTKNQQNKVIKCLFCCVQCILACIQKCIDYVSRNALAWSAVRGDNFCTSAGLAIGVLAANPLRASAMAIVGNFLIFFGKICIAIITTGVAGVIIQYSYKDAISSPILPLIVIFLLSYLVATLFMEVFETAMDTMFLCVCADKDGKYAPPSLLKALDLAGEHAKKLDDADTKDTAETPSNKVADTKTGQQEMASVSYTGGK